MQADLARSRRGRNEALQVAVAGPCICSGGWTRHVKESFHINGIDVAELCADILKAMTEGRSESVPVVVLAGARGGEGKSS